MTEKRIADDEGEILQNIDVLEDLIFHFDRKLLDILLMDRTSRRNILWATTDYESIGAGYEEFSQISPDRIVGRYSILIQPRVAKSVDSQMDRTRSRAEVFTPCWVCNNQNNLVDAQWFGELDVFNTANDTGWVATQGKISFPNSKKTWKRYVDAPRMEISCGEAPYLVSRYDVVTGEKIPTEQRIGMLDRKLRIVNENTETAADWIKWTVRAFQSVYGYEYQGDNLLLARENLLYTFIDYYHERFSRMPDDKFLRKIALIISWNLWQMDGLKGVIPNSCQPTRYEDITIFGTKFIEEPCPGCLKDDMQLHTGIYCKIKDWRSKKTVKFITMMKGVGNCARI